VSTRPNAVSALGRPPVVAALGVITLLVVVWAAAAPRPAKVIPGLHEGIEVNQQAPADDFISDAPTLDLKRVAGPLEQVNDGLASVLGWASVAALAVLAAFCLYVVLRNLLAQHEDRTPEVDDATDLDLEALAVAVAADASDRLVALSAGTPAEGIIAAWAHLEATLHEAGVPLPRSRTSSEVSLDVLRRFAVDEHTLRTLAGLYREARWSQHPLSEEDRTRAATAYHALDAALREGMPQNSRGARG
jgi:hypothetical protein